MARVRVATATRDARLARVAAGGELRRRARRRSRALRWALTVAAVVAVGLIVIIVVLGVVAGRQQASEHDRDDALGAARSAVTAMLTADPVHPDAYLDTVLAVTTGQQHDRLTRARGALADLVASGSPSTGRVLSAGVVSGPDDGQTRIMLAAEASDAQLIGGRPEEHRITVSVLMVHSGSGWKVGEAQPL